VQFFFLGNSASKVKCSSLAGSTDASGTATISCQLINAGAVSVRAQGPGVVNPNSITLIVKKLYEELCQQCGTVLTPNMSSSLNYQQPLAISLQYVCSKNSEQNSY
jgi:hypothetical protein